MSNQPDIQIRGVSFAYQGTPVLEDVNLSVGTGESICMVGPNGGGKTTLVKLILGLLNPDRGKIRLFGLSPHRARLRVGYMPQHVRYDPLFPVTVTDVVLSGRLGRGGLGGFFGFYVKADRRAAREALCRLGMEQFARRPFAALSGGQRQRVLIARAICSQADLLLLDEPTANVDMVAETQLFKILRELNRRMTVIVVTHDLGFVSNLVDRVVCVNRKVVTHPTTELSGRVICDLYGSDVSMVRHDNILQEPEHTDG